MTEESNPQVDVQAEPDKRADIADPAVPGTPPDAGTPSTRHLAFGAAGIGIGLIAGVVVGALAGPLFGAITAAVTPSPITRAVETCDVADNAWIVVGDDGDSVSLQTEGDETSGAELTDVVCVLVELDVPDSVITRMDSTRALDGRQTAEWDDLSASWGYHPSNGLDIVIEFTG
ncbi:hypothetical protein [Agromyces bauzanensis]|uniref:Uncharacterized protein n=1 Tax=Agromyces bauzanensis TaxID=1308924 RepID=A0A917PQ62_9MICO|nr:hypothetical protein [Agromyces bauzanensis]GGJ87008.1 hypothetical protein GCM10011372_26810 [Agromyces bauzanensis]